MYKIGKHCSVQDGLSTVFLKAIEVPLEHAHKTDIKIDQRLWVGSL